MKVTQSLIVVMIAASMAAAQSAPSSTSTAAKPGAAKAAPTSPAAGVPAGKPAPTKPAPTKPAAVPAATAAVKRVAPAKPAQPGQPAKAEKANATKGAAATGKSDKDDKDKISIRNKRDPFVSVIQTRNAITPSCAAGKKCLIVAQLVLKGVVKYQSGMLAVVENSQRKAYFLRENDPVFNGQVYKITGDSIIFKEKVLDKLGKESVREVIKRVNKPA